MQVSYSSAERIVRTESSFVTHQATWEGYKASGVVEQYEFLATLDTRTSEICRSMDGRVFRLSEKEVGVNYPPLHPYCRSTVVPYFDDEMDVGERIARDANGQTYYVPGDITYEKWKKDYVDSSAGLASGRGRRDNNGNDLRFVQKIEPKNIQEAVRAYEQTIRHAEVENAYVIRPNGEVFTKSGLAEWVEFAENELGLLKGATVTHNHPAEATQWSFSREDLEFFIRYGLKELRATDERYTYSLSGVSKLTIEELAKVYEEAKYEALDRIIVAGYSFEEIDFHLQHLLVELVANKAGIKYERWSNE
jgi:SPP1 gp7 family putative phage head morphogenesis protein